MSEIDHPLERAARQIEASLLHDRLVVKAFFERSTSTITYVVHDEATRKAAIIDSVLGFDAGTGAWDPASGESVVAHVRSQGLSTEFILETHVHADHISAAHYLRTRLGGRIAISSRVEDVRRAFAELIPGVDRPPRDRNTFDLLLEDGDALELGGVTILALAVPGHTPADMAFVINDAVFTGDTLFMPDCGSARADFPGGDARRLFRSIRRILTLPGRTRLFVCHDYQSATRASAAWQTTVSQQLAENIHANADVAEDDFVRTRTLRDSTLPTPRLYLEALRENLRGGCLVAPGAGEPGAPTPSAQVPR